MSTVFALPGLGSHHYRMGQAFAESDVYFRDKVNEIDSMVRNQLGWSVLDFLHDPSKKIYESFDHLIKSCISTFLIEISTVKWLANKGIFPDYFLASSFGTLISGVASGCISEEESIHYLAGFATVFEQISKTGGMLAVMSPVDLYYNNQELMSLSEISGVNFDAHFMLSFPEENRHQIESILKREGVARLNIPVNTAFHSRWVDEVKPQFFDCFNDIGSYLFAPPIVSVAHKDMLPAFEVQSLWEVFREPMHFQETLLWLEAKGPHKYIDVGPSGTLATLMKYALPSDSKSSVTAIFSTYHSNMNKIQLDNLT